ncbi:unnamed protein product [Clonostachys rosea]|uniref:Uncharacterized protein n=1 Tax=Bionectria ochroleuca TaxID=29856 RepID=A0ABY6U4N5_BIOOC|nr:unnamed protein product [Clonostachys rosea]
MSTKTSGRPRTHFDVSLCGYGVLLNMQKYDAEFRQRRKLVHRQLGMKAARYEGSRNAISGIQDMESRRLLARVLDEPESLRQHIKTEASAIILRMTYGYTVKHNAADPLVVLIEGMMHDLSFAFTPLSWTVENDIGTPIPSRMASGDVIQSGGSQVETHAPYGDRISIRVRSTANGEGAAPNIVRLFGHPTARER